MWVWFFLFQAEDGIQVLVRSRGLGDVYKRHSRIITECKKKKKRQPERVKIKYLLLTLSVGESGKIGLGPRICC